VLILSVIEVKLIKVNTVIVYQKLFDQKGRQKYIKTNTTYP
jgi:hypothetical protein